MDEEKLPPLHIPVSAAYSAVRAYPPHRRRQDGAPYSAVRDGSVYNPCQQTGQKIQKAARLHRKSKANDDNVLYTCCPHHRRQQLLLVARPQKAVDLPLYRLGALSDAYSRAALEPHQQADRKGCSELVYKRCKEKAWINALAPHGRYHGKLRQNKHEILPQ